MKLGEEQINKLVGVCNGADTKSSIDAVRNVLFRCSNGILEAASTRLDQWTVYAVTQCDEWQQGLVDASHLSSLLNGKKMVDVSIHGNTMLVDDGVVKSRLSYMDASGFPEQPLIKGEWDAVPEGFIDAVKQAKHYVSKDWSRGALCGVYMGDKAVAGTDGHRLCEIACNTPVQDCVMPVSLAWSIGYGAERFMYSHKWLCFASADTTWMAKEIGQPYPDYTKGIPQDFRKIEMAPKAELLNALQGVSWVHGQSKLVKLTFDGDTLTVSRDDAGAESKSVVKLSNQVEKSEENEESFDIGFNINYITQVIRDAAGENVIINMNDEKAAVVVEGDEDEGVTMLIMPLRIFK